MKMEDKCNKCGAYKGHSPTCVDIDFDEAKKQLLVYFEKYQNMQKEITQQRMFHEARMSRKLNAITDERDRYKGKFLTVKQENNALRRKLNKG